MTDIDPEEDRQMKKAFELAASFFESAIAASGGTLEHIQYGDKGLRILEAIRDELLEIPKEKRAPTDMENAARKFFDLLYAPLFDIVGRTIAVPEELIHNFAELLGTAFLPKETDTH